MRNRGMAVLALGAALAVPGMAGVQRRSVEVTDQYIERQAGLAQQDVQRRSGEIEKRFAEEMVFRSRMKDERVAFERQLILDRKAFLESLKRVRLADRVKSLEAFYAHQKQKRKEFSEQRKAESQRFWEARRAQTAEGRNGK